MTPEGYKDERPPEHFARFHERAREARPDWLYDVARVFLTPLLLLVYRARCIDSHKVPARGPAIIAPNHFSFLDHFFVGLYLRRKVQFMAKSQLFTWPMQILYSHGGVFPVRRGQRDEEAFATARAILERGDLLVMYPEGGRSPTKEHRDVKPGIGRLALETGVPVVPTAVVGTEEIRDWKRLRFPKVTVLYGDPLRFERVERPNREQSQAAAEEIFARVTPLYSSLRREGRRRTVKAARAARRAAEGAARQAATPS